MALLEECGDILYAIRSMCGGEGWALDLDWDMIEKRAQHKKRSIVRYLHHQTTDGSVAPPALEQGKRSGE